MTRREQWKRLSEMAGLSAEGGVLPPTSTVPSEEALARQLLNTPHLSGGYNTEVKRFTKILDRVIAEREAQARLEGAKAMQVKCADVIEDLDGNTYADHLRALDPQQVINESMGK
jgi:hypothetical protein